MNKSLFKIHSWAALVAFLPLLVICLSGSILVFKHEIDTLLMPDQVRVQPASEREDLDNLLQSINQQYPNYEVVGWVLFQDPARADMVYIIEHGTSEWSYLLLDGYTGKILAAPVPHDQRLTDWLLELHYTLLLEDTGLAIATLFALILLLLGISGLVLHRKFWKNFFTLRWNSRLVVYFSDLHKMIGIISAPVLLILGFTGAWWNVTSLLHELEEFTEGQEHHIMQERLYSNRISLDAITHEAEQSIEGFKATYLSLPWEPNVDITIWGDVPTGNPLSSEYSSIVSFDAQTGKKLSHYDIREASTGAFIVDTYSSLHYGTFAGLFSKVAWCVLGAMPLILSITGLTLWFKRRKQRARAKLKKQAPAAIVN